MKQPLLSAAKESRSKSKKASAKFAASAGASGDSSIPLNSQVQSKHRNSKAFLAKDKSDSALNGRNSSSNKRSNLDVSTGTHYRSEYSASAKSPWVKLSSDEGLLELKRKVKESDVISDELAYRRERTRSRNNLTASQQMKPAQSSPSPPAASKSRGSSPDRYVKNSPEPAKNLNRPPVAQGTSPKRLNILERSESPKSVGREFVFSSGKNTRPLEFGITGSTKEMLIKETRFVDKKDVNRALVVDEVEVLPTALIVQAGTTPKKEVLKSPAKVADQVGPRVPSPLKQKGLSLQESVASKAGTPQPVTPDSKVFQYSAIMGSKRTTSPKKAVEALGFNQKLATRQNQQKQIQIAESLRLSESKVQEKLSKVSKKSTADLVPIKSDGKKQAQYGHKSEARLVKAAQLPTNESQGRFRNPTPSGEVQPWSRSTSKPKVEKIDVSPTKPK